MERDPVVQSETGERRDIIDDPVRVIGDGTDQEDRIGVDQAADAGNRDTIAWGGTVDGVEFYLEVVGGFIEGGMRSGGDNPKTLSIGAGIRVRDCPAHLWLRDATFDVSFLSC